MKKYSWLIALAAVFALALAGFTSCGGNGNGGTSTAEEDNAAITTAKAAVEGATYTAVQVMAATEAQAKTRVEAIIGALNLGGVETTVVAGVFTAAKAGDKDDYNGVNGAFTFTVNLNKGDGDQQTTSQLALTITATVHVPLFSLAQWMTENPDLDTLPEWGFSASSAPPSSPFAVSNATQAVIDIVDGAIEYTMAVNGGAINIFIDGRGLNLDPENNIYEITIAGFVKDASNAAGDNPQLRLERRNPDSTDNRLLNHPISPVEDGTAFDETVTVPANLADHAGMRLITSADGVGIVFVFTEIKVELIGPRE
jgi:hypothetical protein